MIPADGTFLSPDEREEIIELVTLVIAQMDSDGRRNLLLACGLKDIVIDRVKLNGPPRNVAEAMLRLTETWDKPNSELCYLREFLCAVIKDAGYKGTAVEIDTTCILSNYDHKRNAQKNETRHTKNHLSRRPEDQDINQTKSNIKHISPQTSPLEIFLLGVVEKARTAKEIIEKIVARYNQRRMYHLSLRSEDQDINQTKSNIKHISPQTSPYKIDVRIITQCNLYDQKRDFTNRNVKEIVSDLFSVRFH